MNIEGLGESLVDQLIEQGLVQDFGDLYTSTPRSSRTSSSSPREPRSERAVPRKLGKVGRNVVEQIERSKQNDLSRLVYALGIRHVGEKAAGDPRHGTCGRWTRSSTRRSRRCRPCRRSGRSWPRRSGAFADEPHNRALIDEAGGRRRQHGQPAARAERGRPRAAGRQDVRPDRHAADDDPRGGRGGDRAAGRQGVRVGQQEDDRAWWSGPTPAASSTRRERSACRS